MIHRLFDERTGDELKMRTDANVLVLFGFLLDIANLLGDGLERILIVRVLRLQFCELSARGSVIQGMAPYPAASSQTTLAVPCQSMYCILSKVVHVSWLEIVETSGRTPSAQARDVFLMIVPSCTLRLASTSHIRRPLDQS